MDSIDDILEGWEQIAAYLRYSESHLRRLFRLFPVSLKHWRGPGHRIRMTKDEAGKFEKKFKREK